MVGILKISVVLILLLSSILQADTFPFPVLDRWMYYEQRRANIRVDPSKIDDTRDEHNLNYEYRPQTAAHFRIGSFWVPETEWTSFTAPKLLPQDVYDDLVKIQDGIKYYRIFVHPQSLGLYGSLLSKHPLNYDHFATPSSSARSLLVLPDSKRPPYFAKVSLDIMYGGSNRTIPSSEVIHSVGLTDYASKQLLLNSRFSLIPDSFGVIPNDMSRKGQIIRTIPEKVLTNKKLPIPLFSLYAPDEAGQTLFETWVQKSGLSPEEFAKKYLIEPFAKAWTDWALKGITHEAHAQNVLIEVDPATEFPTGNFFLRDVGGVFLNPRSHQVKSIDLKNLPAPNGFYWDYQKWADSAETTSLNTYFVGGFLFNLDKELKRLNAKYRSGSVVRDLYNTVREQLATDAHLSRKKATHWAMKDQMGVVLREARERKEGKPTPTLGEKLGRPLNIGFYSGTFDPPHRGHRELIETAIKEENLDLVIISPNFKTPHKPGAQPYNVRKKMAQMVFNAPKMTLVWDNFEDSSKRGGSDAVLRKMLQHYEPDVHFFRILGDDSFDFFNQSNQGLTNERLTYLVTRRNQDTTDPLPSFLRRSPVKYLPTSQTGWSSTQVRKDLLNSSRSNLISQEVQDFIIENGLYSCNPILNRLGHNNSESNQVPH